VDLNRDGLLDLISVAQFADANNVLDSGAVYVFQGTPTLSGLVAPVATLTVPGAKVMDELGAGNHQGAFFTDVTGDGLLDILGVAPFANVAGAQDAGALYLWQGGPLLIGPLSPLTTMTVPGAKPSDQLGG
jgi:hypothetical protein